VWSLDALEILKICGPKHVIIKPCFQKAVSVYVSFLGRTVTPKSKSISALQFKGDPASSALQLGISALQFKAPDWGPCEFGVTVQISALQFKTDKIDLFDI
jgi:hypothetical protein